MAKGKRCPVCNHQLYAEREDVRERGSWVYYRCTNPQCKHTEKVFEDAPFNPYKK